MDIHHLNALRLGFSSKLELEIKTLGLGNFIEKQLNSTNTLKEPLFLSNSPKNLEELRAMKQSQKKEGEEADEISKSLVKTRFEWKAFIIERCNETEFPLREKINLFFQNHFVATLQSVKVPYWIFKHYQTINSFSVANYKTLVKEMVYSNAMIKYLDNQQNRKGKINENLGRELLELFTLGEGNYSEADIKNTSLALAGLTFGEEKGIYRSSFKDNSQKTVFGETGNFIIDDVIDIIFRQKNTPYFLSEKVLKWFFYDNPPKDLVVKYGDVLRNNDFELKPFFTQLFTEECKNSIGGNQIKNPLVFFLQVHNDLGITPNYKLLTLLLKNQAMDIYDQPNVKGWRGGKDWITSQIYADRNQFIDLVIDGNPRFEKALNKRLEKFELGNVVFHSKIKLPMLPVLKLF
jgi:uncharacterized protein (DUF1800 family)